MTNYLINKKLLFLILFVSIFTLPAFAQHSSQSSGKLMLVGGGLKTCSSMAQHNCKMGTEFSKNAKLEPWFKVTEKRLQTLPKYQHLFEPKSYLKLTRFLNKIAKQSKQLAISKQQLMHLIKSHDSQRTISNLNDKQYYVLLDVFEVPLVSQNTRFKEQVKLADSKDLHSSNIYYDFVKQAALINGHKKPNIVVLTASARDPFEAADFYQQVFQLAGGNSQWLPLDATLNFAWQQAEYNRCDKLDEYRLEQNGSVERKNIYPDLYAKQVAACQSPKSLLKAIAQADGIFINGGDQSLTVKAFKNLNGRDNQVLTLIKQKLLNNQLIVGGTSAGTAVMSGQFNEQHSVMITNGRSESALQRGAVADQLPIEGCQKNGTCNPSLLNVDLTYNSTGGLGLVPFAIMDTHFSERGRQGRVAVLAQHSKANFVFGVDEATAMLMSDPLSDSPSFEVLGAAGVWVLQPTKPNKALIHYLNYGDRGVIRDKELSITFSEKEANEKQKIRANTKDIFEGDNFKQWLGQVCYERKTPLSANYRWQDEAFKVLVSRTEHTQTKARVDSRTEQDTQVCSYKNLLFEF